METKYQWTLVKKIPHAHKWFRNELDGRIAVCDDSGNEPHKAEQGIFWLDLSRPIVLYQVSSAMSLEIPVTNNWHIQSRIGGTDLAEVLWLMEEFEMSLQIQGRHSFRIGQQARLAAQLISSMPATFKELLNSGKRYAFFLDRSKRKEYTGWPVSIVFENTAGHFPTGHGETMAWYWDDDTCALENEKLGHNTKAVLDIVASSMGAGRVEK